MALPFSLMVLRNDKPCNDIVFIDGCNEMFFIKDGKSRATLTGWQEIVEAALNPANTAISKVVSVTDVEANDAQLQVSRYCKTSDDEAIEQLLSRYPTKSLSDLVSFVRPMPLSPDGTVCVLEVAPPDFPEYGYVSTPGREIKLSATNVSRGKNQFLRPLDIAVAIKGSVGKVAIMPKDTPEKTWVIGQSCIILRVDEKSFPIDPHVIFSYLKSDVGQLQLKNIVSGSAVSVIQLRELEKIKIPLPVAAEAKDIITSFEKIVDIEKAIAGYRDQQQQLTKAVWPN